MMLSFVFIAFNLLPSRAIATEVIKSAAITPAVTQSVEEIQACLDKKRKTVFEARQRIKASAPAAGVSPYRYRKVDASDLAAPGCEEGDLSALKKALTKQAAACGTASGKVLAGLVKGMPTCKRAHEKNCIPKGQRKSYLAKHRAELVREYNTKTTKQLGCRMVSRGEYCRETNLKLLDIATKAKTFQSFLSEARKQFDWYKSEGRVEDDTNGRFRKGDVQFTAYYSTPAVEARKEAKGEYKYPVYGKPEGLTHVTDNESGSCGNDPLTGQKISWCLRDRKGKYTAVPPRSQIETLRPKRIKPLYYVKDPVDVALMMLQGSGKLRVNTGSQPCGKKNVCHEVQLNYDGQNGRTRFMLGSIISCLSDARAEDYASETGLRNYLATHADQRSTLLNLDQSFVFFKAGAAGAIGADGLPVTAGHTLATDRKVIPGGAAVFFDVKHGQKQGASSCQHSTSLALSQDTGGAIVGPHVDWYMGDTAEAKAKAGSFNHPGSIAIAVPKGAGQPVPECKE